MANVKSAGIRELIIDRCLQERRGYTVEELLKKVNEALEIEGLRPVTAGNTIRNDINNIANRWKQCILKGKRGKATTFAYEDENFSIFNCQLTQAELRLFHSVLLSVMFMDAYQGSLVCQEMNDRLKDLLHIDGYQLPILMYENVPTKRQLDIFHKLYDSIIYKQPVHIEHAHQRAGPKKETIHPHFMRQHQQQWHLLGLHEQQRKPVCIPISSILSVADDNKTTYITHSLNDLDDYHKALFKIAGK